MNRVHDVTTQLFPKKRYKTYTTPFIRTFKYFSSVFQKYEELIEVRSRKNCTEVQDLE